nr:protein YeeZ-like isoform X1 [Ipomoea batatas]
MSAMGTCPSPRPSPAVLLRRSQNPNFFSYNTAPCFPYVRCTLIPTCATMETQFQGRMFILGMGFVGEFFAADLKSKGWTVSGTCTSAAKKKKLDEMGYDAFVFDAKDPLPEVLDVMKCHSHLLISIPPVPGTGDPMLQHRKLLNNRLKGGDLQWLGYLSSTSVYGDCSGAWVDEEFPARPTTESARARLAAEEGWLQLGLDLEIASQVFRLGGIYGPGRSAVDTILKQGTLSKSQLMRSSKRFTSRIHVADICQALNASIQKPSPGRIYNIVDDDPAPRKEVFRFAESLVEKKWPDSIKQCNLTEDAPSSLGPKGAYNGGEKRVSNGRMKEELGVRLLYPTYKTGLASIVERVARPPLQAD